MKGLEANPAWLKTQKILEKFVAVNNSLLVALRSLYSTQYLLDSLLSFSILALILIFLIEFFDPKFQAVFTVHFQSDFTHRFCISKNCCVFMRPVSLLLQDS